MKREDGRKLPPQTQQAIRVRIVAFLKSGKGTQQQAADIFMVNLRTVKKIWKKFKDGGLKAIRMKKRGPVKSTARLSQMQNKQVTQCIKKHTPDYYGLPYFLWTADAVGLLIKKKPG
jgi:transposase